MQDLPGFPQEEAQPWQSTRTLRCSTWLHTSLALPRRTTSAYSLGHRERYRQPCPRPMLTTRWLPAHVARAQPQEHLARRFDMRRKRGIVLHGHVNIPKVALQRMGAIDGIRPCSVKYQIDCPDGF